MQGNQLKTLKLRIDSYSLRKSLSLVQSLWCIIFQASDSQRQTSSPNTEARCPILLSALRSNFTKRVQKTTEKKSRRFRLISILQVFLCPSIGWSTWWIKSKGYRWTLISSPRLRHFQARTETHRVRWTWSRSFQAREPGLLSGSSSRFSKWSRSIQARKTRTRSTGRDSSSKGSSLEGVWTR